MKLSIVIPVFQIAPYIERCLASVMQQAVPDVECLLVDDGCTDNSMTLATQALEGYDGPITFRILTHPSNRGLSAARNTGIEAATGTYILFLDGDDALMPGALKALLAAVEAYPGVDVVQGNSTVAAETLNLNKGSCPIKVWNKRQYSLNTRLPVYTDQQPWLTTSMLERKCIPVTSWNKLIRRAWLEANGIWFKEGILHEDEHWTFFAAQRIGSMAFCRDVTYVHYLRKGSIMRSQGDKSILSWFEIIGDMIANLDESASDVRRKVVLEVSFCNLVRIVKKGSKTDIPRHLAVQRRLLEPLFTSISPRNETLERWLLGWFDLPVWLLRILCTRHIKGLYLRPLSLYKT